MNAAFITEKRGEIMKSTGIIRPVDALGRVVIPMEIREVFDIKTKDHLEIYVQGDTIVLKKHTEACTFCNEAEDLVDFEGKKICKRCLHRLSNLE